MAAYVAHVKSRTSSSRWAILDTRPTGLSYREVFGHLDQNCLARLATRWYGVAGLALGTGLTAVMEPGATVSVLTGAAASYSLLATAYLVWYASFVRQQRYSRPLCPECTAPIWQLCCARCREPVPPLALWLRGLFLSRCPHCDLALSARGGTLLAWCSTCSAGTPRPDRMYAKPAHVILCLVNRMPNRVEGGWRPLCGGSPARLYHHPGDEHSGSLLCIVEVDRHMQQLPLPAHLAQRVRLVLLDAAIDSRERGRLEGIQTVANARLKRVINLTGEGLTLGGK